MMKKRENELLEEAYLSITKKPTTEATPEEPVSVGPMDGPAPGVEATMVSSDAAPVDSANNDTVGAPVDMMSSDCRCGQTPCMCDSEVDLQQEDEEDQMALDNLNSVRESIVKVASYCAGGGHLEIWAQQKLAIAMDNLAEIARRLH